MISRAPSTLARLLGLAGRIACLIVIASFVVFAVDQTGNASTRQQNELNEGSSAPAGSTAAKAAHESSLHRVLDEAADALTSPFAGAVSGSHSQWTIHIVRTVLALLAYGLGLGFLARFIRIRV